HDGAAPHVPPGPRRRARLAVPPRGARSDVRHGVLVRGRRHRRRDPVRTREPLRLAGPGLPVRGPGRVSPLGWLAALLLLGVGAALFVILTEGRFGGRRLIEAVYDVAGPRSFSRETDAGRWRVLAGDLGVRPGTTTLDVGCATGDLVVSWAALEGFHGVAVGIDRSRPMLEVAEKVAAERGLAHATRFLEADLDDGLPVPDGAVGVVTCLGVLEVIRRPEALAAELARVL